MIDLRNNAICLSFFPSEMNLNPFSQTTEIFFDNLYMLCIRHITLFLTTTHNKNEKNGTISKYLEGGVVKLSLIAL